MKLETIKKWLLAALIILLPTQLGMHFWPDSAFINGVRIDYFSPTLYVTDIVIFLLVLAEIGGITWEMSLRKRMNWPVVIGGSLIVLFAVVNIWLSLSPAVSTYKWARVLELGVLGYMVVRNSKFLMANVKLWLIPVGYESILAMWQFWAQSSIGGLWYWAGERSFNASSLGSANAYVNGMLVLRPEGTFPHPNVLGGYLAIALPFILHYFLHNSRNITAQWKRLVAGGWGAVLILGYAALFLSLSRSAIVVGLGASVVVALPYLKRTKWVVAAVIIGLVGAFYALSPRFGSLGVENEPIVAREQLTNWAIRNWARSPIWGTGLGTAPLYSTLAADYSGHIKNYALVYQPTHNIYLLTLAETGTVGLGLVLGLIYVVGRRQWRRENYLVLTPLISILVIGLFDHYWLTLQQAQLLLVLVLGLTVSSVKIKKMTSLSGKIATNTMSQVAGKAGSAMLGLATTLVLTRYLGPTDFGTFTFIFVLVTLFGTLADWGTTLIAVREASKDSGAAGKIIGNMVVVRLSLALVAAILAATTAWVLPNMTFLTRILTSVAAVELVFLSLKTSFQIIFNVKMKMHNWAISELASDVPIFVLVIVGAVLNLKLPFMVLSYLLGDIVAAIVAYYLSRKLMQLKFELNNDKTKFLLWEAVPMGAILVVFTIYNRIDTVILSYFKGNTAVGYYGLAYKIFEVLVLGAAYYANSVLPVISNLAANDRQQLGVVYRKSFVVLAWLGVGAALANFLMAPVLPYIFGAKYFYAVAPLQILSLALVVSYFNHLNGYTLIALGRQWWSFAVALVALGVNVVLNLWLIPQYSYLGAAFNTFITEALIVALSLVLIRRQLGVTPRLADFWEVSKEIVQKRGKIF